LFRINRRKGCSLKPFNDRLQIISPETKPDRLLQS
jgi:hypothetical protein